MQPQQETYDLVRFLCVATQMWKEEEVSCQRQKGFMEVAEDKKITCLLGC